ncbi:hypothetical protein NG895_14495 [Aeoliella sp. ICT_H6.2]|uniref:Uncharacterized protein n=1 Tax=Aeoliella straminimaris TaxID=2954799 RepID=A0A9X2JH54_9BACT|nr:hypothetical protein [Aeoliella straminimaris]MCO6045117.1 hypothetical protein [Aeoliella straminimaris]
MDQQPPRFRGPRFGIGLLVLLMTLLAVAAAALGGLRRGGDQRAFFVIFTLIAPGFVLIVVSLWQKFLRPR